MKPPGAVAFLFGLVASVASTAAENYFPPPDDHGGWRTLSSAAEIRRVAGIDVAKLDATFEFIQGRTKNGGLLVLRHGWLAYERYFGLGHRDATQIAPRQGWKETVDATTAARATLQNVIAAIAPATTKAAAEKPPTHQAPSDVFTIPLETPRDRLLLNLMMEGRLAWFSWMNQPRLKPKLVVDWTAGGKPYTRTWQHGVDGSDWPQAIFLLRGDEPGLVRWGGHEELGAGREGHKHHFFAKDAPPRVAFIKADLSEIPSDATIVRAELALHIHDSEGLKAGDGPEAGGVGRFRHVNKDWNWDHITFTHYAAGKPWTTPTNVYPFLGAGDVSPVLWSLDRQKDLAARGYHKNGMRDYPLDLTAYVARLQQLRTRPTQR